MIYIMVLFLLAICACLLATVVEEREINARLEQLNKDKDDEIKKLWWRIEEKD